ncbi:30S ribosomal protein S4 [Planctomycetes bacterium Poly30]|uniref:Small ribosomal subunit protein uS4 n=1 Tax=Saltatorellus ferox TaxID=2528018 RepID=A0A518EWB8_9BACT|nr:30S ribosomal protein S4 [Planctomycetes bacterium Poly30]
MARYTGPKIKQCRREGMNLFFLGQNTSSGKVAVLQRRDYPPGVHAQSRRKVTDYGVRLREKQKLKRVFGVLERQFKRYFAEAERMKGNTGENLLTLLSRRLDNVVLSAGFATTLAQARQMVNHGHYLVNGKRVTIPSFRVRAGDVVQPRTKENTKKIVSGFIDVNKGGFRPEWLSVDDDAMSVTVTTLPKREDFQFPIQEQLIVELCSK